MIQQTYEKDMWISESQVKSLVTKFKTLNMKQSKAAINPELDPEEMRTEVEDEIDQELLFEAMHNASNILNKKKNWLTSHPLQVKTFFIRIDKKRK